MKITDAPADLNIEKALVTIDGTVYDLTIPPKTVKLIKPFDIVEAQTTTLTLDFNANESIKSAGKDNYVMIKKRKKCISYFLSSI